MGLLQTASYIWRHPLSRGRRLANLKTFAAWQIGSRLVPGPVAIPFTDKAQLLARPGMTSATGHVYVGLQEFEDMAFVVHALRPGDWFADIGANIGAYTVLASAVAGAHTLSFEPGEAARGWLERNIALNRIGARVEVRPEAVGAAPGAVEFTVDFDTTNAVVAPGAKLPAGSRCVSVSMTTLDDECRERCPTVIKIDVEGFETEVIAGAEMQLARPELLALVIEMNGSGKVYGHDEAALARAVKAQGFETVRYDPRRRALVPINPDEARASNNVIFARPGDAMAQRLRDAPPFSIHSAPI